MYQSRLLNSLQVLNLLGSTAGTRIVELGAGIGRFTAEIAKEAQSVIALDFMQNLIDQNRVNNGHLGNIEFRCGDATQLELEEASADIVFSNWLLMYLSDSEIETLAQKMLRWLVDDGVVFFRESCFRQSGDRSRANNPTHYRNPRQYFDIFDKTRVARPDGGYDYFELVVCKSVDTYVKVKHNQNQVCWKWKKVSTPSNPSSNDLRYFLDKQYSTEGISKYQMMFGHGFVSPGGIQTTEEFARLLEVKEDESVLDVGCGVGGAAFYLAEKYQCYVHGLDLSVNMIMTALEKAAALDHGSKVSFEVSNAARRDLIENSYDAVFSRDAFFYIQDKSALLEKIYKVLKPGGRFVFTDYCRAAGETSTFQQYVEERGYSLATLAEYEALISGAGFTVVSVEDRTEQLISCLGNEIDNIDQSRATFESSLGADSAQSLKASWLSKLQFAKDGQHTWGLFVAMKK